MAHLPAQCAAGMSLKNSRGANVLELSEMLAGSTGLEPAASGVTVMNSHDLNYCSIGTYIAEEKPRWQAPESSV